MSLHELRESTPSGFVRQPETAEAAEALGYTVDRHCYPWIAYKGQRFTPTEWFVVQTPPNTPADKVIQPPTFEQASAAYRKATEVFEPILQREALDVVKRHISDASVVRVLGEYNDDGLLTMRVQAVFSQAGALATVEHPTEAFEAMCDEADPLFDWLITFNEEWWMGTHDIDIATGDALQVNV